jgi:hypothetical protein
MFFTLPYEIQEMIMQYTTFYDCINHGYTRIARKLYHPEYCHLAILNKDYKLLYLLDKYRMFNDLDNFVAHLAINSYNIDIVSLIYKNFPTFFTGQYLDIAASNGCLDIVKFLNKYIKGSTDAMDCASMNGHYEMLIWLFHNGYECTTYAFEYATKYNHMDIVKWLHRNKRPYTKNCIDNAIKYGHLDLLKWLYKYKPEEDCSSDAINQAIALGNSSTVIWMFENKYNNIDVMDAVIYAIKYDKEAILDFICNLIIEKTENKINNKHRREHTI